MVEDCMNILIVGKGGGTNIAGNVSATAKRSGYQVELIDITPYYGKNRLERKISWLLMDKKPIGINRLRDDVEQHIGRGLRTILTVGLVPFEREVIRNWTERGIKVIHYASDDPWNRRISPSWYKDSLRAYKAVFTPRISNVLDIAMITRKNVHYLPFSYSSMQGGMDSAREEDLRNAIKNIHGQGSDIIVFVGGADPERVRFIRGLIRKGIRLILVGQYWDRYAVCRDISLGWRTKEEVDYLTKITCASLILLKKENRDGHTMRTIEAAASGATLLVEDSLEHRIFFRDGYDALFFSDVEECAKRVSVICSGAGEGYNYGANAMQAISMLGFDYGTFTQRLIEA